MRKTKVKRKEELKSQKAITLIALVITIIVLLILAAVSIVTLTGENGLLTKVGDAKIANDVADVKEQAQLDIANWIAERLKNGQDTTLDDATVKSIIEDANADKTDKYYSELTTTSIITNQGNEILLSDLYNKTSGGDTPIFDADTLTIGEAINTGKYGWKVTNYTVTTDEFTTGVWRLFYQDSNYTYLITDECVGSYKPSDYYTTITNEGGELKYQTGADVSTVGQKLNPMLLEAGTFFTADNTNTNIMATAWLTDPEVWSSYANSDAVFAIGSPTVELFAASYNNTGKAYTIEPGLGTYGYTENTGSGWLSVDDNHGIYNKSTSSIWWLASPNGGRINRGLMVNGNSGYISYNYVYSSSYAVRPLVCIPTSVFNSVYTLEDN